MASEPSERTPLCSPLSQPSSYSSDHSGQQSDYLLTRQSTSIQDNTPHSSEIAVTGLNSLTIGRPSSSTHNPYNTHLGTSNNHLEGESDASNEHSGQGETDYKSVWTVVTQSP